MSDVHASTALPSGLDGSSVTTTRRQNGAARHDVDDSSAAMGRRLSTNTTVGGGSFAFAIPGGGGGMGISTSFRRDGTMSVAMASVAGASASNGSTFDEDWLRRTSLPHHRVRPPPRPLAACIGRDAPTLDDLEAAWLDWHMDASSVSAATPPSLTGARAAATTSTEPFPMPAFFASGTPPCRASGITATAASSTSAGGSSAATEQLQLLLSPPQPYPQPTRGGRFLVPVSDLPPLPPPLLPPQAPSAAGAWGHRRRREDDDGDRLVTLIGELTSDDDL